ncbi:YcnI family protein [Paenibacillus enshidis]|uniref:YcnI family protein n=1 Tax=Paenibacillus enshidis TaxID=1458439 RepID=A0ABV5AXF2_9BACL
MNTHNRSFKKKLMKLSSTFSAAVAGALLFAGIASAHVTVSPAVSQPEAWETYTIKVPVEKDVATTKVALKIPEGVEFKQYEPIPGWKVSTTAADSGAVKTVTWTAEGKGILAGQYQRFSFVAVNPSAEAKVAWDAFQYYADGSIVEWTGDEGSDLPHSVTTVTADPAAAPEQSGHNDAKTGHDGTPGAADTNEGEQTATDSSAAVSQAAPAASASSGVQTATLVISIAALVLSAAALLRALKSRR